MKERRILPRLLCILLFAALSAGLYVLSAKGSSRVPLAFAMAFAVMAAETLLVLILSLFHPESHRSRTLLTLVQSLLKYVAAIVILCWGLRLLGVDLSTIVTAVGILALVLGFGAESLISDLVTGTFMLFENQYNVGDIVEVNGFRGTVKEIGVRPWQSVTLTCPMRRICLSWSRSFPPCWRRSMQPRETPFCPRRAISAFRLSAPPA